MNDLQYICALLNALGAKRRAMVHWLELFAVNPNGAITALEAHHLIAKNPALLAARGNEITRHATVSGGGLPTSIEWMPSGTHRVTPQGFGAMDVVASPEDAAHLNRQLQRARRMARAGIALEPFIDCEHDGRTVAAYAKRLFWDGGIRCELDWTSAGKAALERGLTRFSPTVGSGGGGHPRRIPLSGPIGGLTYNPAFSTIKHIV